MSADDKPPIIELRPTCLIVCPGIEFEEWQAAWNSLDQTSRSINWLIGDALAYGEQFFPERWSQVLDAQYVEPHRGALRVALRIPPPHRREALSWSAHREAAAAETIEERIELLDLAEANGWGSREIAAEVRRRRDARQHNGGPKESRSTWNGDSTFGSVEDITGEPFQIDSADAGAPDVGGGAADTLPPDSAIPSSPTADEIRACIAAVRKIANALALDHAPGSAIDQVEHDVYACIRDAAALGCLTSHERATDLIPRPWRGKITIEFGEHVFGGRAYTVDLRKPGGKQMAAGYGPSLPCALVEAALSCLLSDMDHC